MNVRCDVDPLAPVPQPPLDDLADLHAYGLAELAGPETPMVTTVTPTVTEVPSASEASGPDGASEASGGTSH